MSRFEGKVAFVTGTASGIGRATAQRLADDGAHVFATGRGLDRLDGIYGGDDRFTTIDLDVTDSAAVDAAMSRVDAERGRLDVVINVAGIGDSPRRMAANLSHDITDVTDDDFRIVMETNLYGPFYVIRAAVPLLRRNGEQGGSIVNVSSVAALILPPIQAAYPASKAGVIGLTRGAAASLGADNIRVNSVAPGFTDTAIVPDDPGLRAMLMGPQVLRRIATPEEMAATIVYLASDEASFITGQVLSPNGGYTA